MGENGEIARRALDAFARQSFEEFQRLCSADVALTTLYDDPGAPPRYSGRDGVRRWFERLDELWAFIAVQDAEISEHDDGWVLIRVAARMRGRGSPSEFEPRVTVAAQVVRSEIKSFGLFPDEADALALVAAG